MRSGVEGTLHVTTSILYLSISQQRTRPGVQYAAHKTPALCHEKQAT